MRTNGGLTHLAAGATFFAAGVISAHTWLATPLATAQTTKQDPKPPTAFLAADERMEPVVREILTTMKKMDQRLESIEKSLTGAKRAVSESAEPGARGRSR